MLTRCYAPQQIDISGCRRLELVMLHKAEDDPAEHRGWVPGLKAARGQWLPHDCLPSRFQLSVVRGKVREHHLCWHVPI